MKTIGINKITLLNDYIMHPNSRELNETELQFCIRSMKDNILFLLKRKQDVTDEDLDKCIYELTNILMQFEKLLAEADCILKE